MKSSCFNRKQNNKVYGVLSIPPHATKITIFSHGFSSSKESKIYLDLEKELNKKGIGTLRYDYYGHGERPENLEEFTLTKGVHTLHDAIAYIRGQGNYDIVLLGASFGGVISLVASSQDKTIKSLVLKSPVIEPKEFWKNRLGEEGLKRWQKERILHYDDLGERFDLKYSFWEDLQAYNTLELARKIKCPIFIIHGSLDQVVPIRQSQYLLSVLGVKLKIVEGADHSYNNPQHYKYMKEEIVKFFDKTVVPGFV
jgi:uncharacterized protein